MSLSPAQRREVEHLVADVRYELEQRITQLEGSVHQLEGVLAAHERARHAHGLGPLG